MFLENEKFTVFVEHSRLNIHPTPSLKPSGSWKLVALLHPLSHSNLLEAGSWKLSHTHSLTQTFWKLEAGSWKLEALSHTLPHSNLLETGSW
jgi:hypothetical protein